MPCPKTADKEAARFMEKLKGVFSAADCITAQTAVSITGLTYFRAWRRLKALAAAGYIEIQRVEKGGVFVNLYCLKGRRPEKIYLHDGHKAYLITLRDVAKAVEAELRGFATHTASVKIRHLKNALGLPNTALVGILLKHMVLSVIKDAVIREEVRDSTGVFTIVLVVDKEKALKLIEEYKRGSPPS
jgi:hypothetical protein